MFCVWKQFVYSHHYDIYYNYTISLRNKDLTKLIFNEYRYPREREPTSRTFQELIQCHADVYRACIAVAGKAS